MKQATKTTLSCLLGLAVSSAGAAGGPEEGGPQARLGPPSDLTRLSAMEIATGPDSNADGYLSISADEYGSWGGFGVLNSPTEDLFNPSGTAPLQQVAFTAGFFLFVPEDNQRELLSDIPDWQAVFAPDSTLDREITQNNVASDTNADGVDDTLSSAFRVDGGATRLSFDLTQTVSSAGPGIGLLRQDYTITNGGSAPISMSLVRTFDGDLLWEGDFSDDEVGTTMHDAGLGPYVYQQEAGSPSTTAITISGLSGGDYYGGKNGVLPADGPPAYGFGTDLQVWDAYGVPDSWRSHIAGVGYGVNGDSGQFPPGFIDPADGFIGMDFPVDLGAGETTTVTVLHTFGQNAPSACVLTLALDSPVAQAGDIVNFDLYLKHNRRQKSRVPFVISLENDEGKRVLSARSAPHTFSFGDSMSQRRGFRLPYDLPAGEYRVVVGIDQMQQDIARASQPLTVIEAK